MYPYNEDVMFERLKDLQREVENSYALAGRLPNLGRLVRILGERVWWIAGLAMRRPPRRHPGLAQVTYEESTEASEAA